MAEEEITEYKLQNYLCFCNKRPSFNNALHKISHIPRYTALNYNFFQFLRRILSSKPCLLIYSPSSL